MRMNWMTVTNRCRSLGMLAAGCLLSMTAWAEDPIDAGSAPEAGEQTFATDEWFPCLWCGAARNRWKLAVVQFPDANKPIPKDSGNNFPVRVISLLNADAESSPLKGTIPMAPPRTLKKKSLSAERYYLGLIYSYQVQNVNKEITVYWSLGMSHATCVTLPGAVRTLKQTQAIPISGPDAPVLPAIRELLYGRDAAGENVNLLDRILHYLKSPDAETRILAANVAGANGMGLSKADEKTDLFARALLDCKDPGLRARMVQAYVNAPGDILPRDIALLERLLKHEDWPVAGVVLLGALPKITDPTRRKALLAPLRELLGGGQEKSRPRQAALQSLYAWEKDALALREDLERIARKGATPREQETALQILLNTQAEDAYALALERLPEFPTAVAMDYLVRNHLYAAVPDILRAVRAEKVKWSETLATGVQLLTGRHDWKEFSSFDAWWAGIEKAHGERDMLEDGFVGSEVRERIRNYLEALASPAYKVREDARRQLLSLCPPIPQELRDAAKSSNLEVALSAQKILQAVQDREVKLLGFLHAAAQQEKKNTGALDAVTMGSPSVGVVGINGKGVIVRLPIK